MTTNVPSPTFGPNGFIIPTEADILTGVLEDFQAAFGGNLNPSLETPQGQLASSEAAIIGNTDATFLYYTTQVDPAFAQGRMQDAIARIYFIERNPAQPTVTQCVCVGLAGVAIPVGALAQAEDGNLYTCTESGTIPVGGSITLTFACNVVGPIVCPANTVTQIYQAIPGWDSINNPTDGIEGNNTESRADFEARRAASVAHNSVGSLPAVYGAVLGVENVIDAYVTENDTLSNVTIRGTTLLPKSLYVAVVGGAALDVATAIWSKKAPGCGYNGNTTVTVYDEDGYVAPFPSYQVTFEIPDPLEVSFAVVVANNGQVPANAGTLIQNAIINAFSGADGGTRARIGTTVYASRFVAPVLAVGSWCQIVSLQIGSANNATAVFVGSIANNVLTVTAIISGIIEIDQFIDGAGVTPGTIAQVFGSGSGGVGTYLVDIAQTVSSQTMSSYYANQDFVDVNIDQVPTTSANNILPSLE